jgi:hypothetical protein
MVTDEFDHIILLVKHRLIVKIDHNKVGYFRFEYYELPTFLNYAHYLPGQILNLFLSLLRI